MDGKQVYKFKRGLYFQLSFGVIEPFTARFYVFFLRKQNFQPKK